MSVNEVHLGEDWIEKHGEAFEQYDSQEIKEKIRRYRKSGEVLNNPVLFSKIYFSHLFDTPIPDVHKKWYELAEKHDRLCLLAPRDHAKSTVFNVIYPILWVCRDRDIRIQTISSTHSQAVKFMRAIRDELEVNQKLINDFGKFKTDYLWSSHELEVKGSSSKKDPTISTTGLHNAKLGNRADLVICDDIIERMDCLTERGRQKARHKFQEVITNYLEEDKGKIIVIGTKQHKADIYHTLKETGEYTYRIYDAIVDEENEETLWPSKWSYQKLMKRKSEIGHIAFSRQFRNHVVDEESSLFPQSLMEDALDNDMNYLSLGEEPPDWLDRYQTYIGCDLAISAGTGADYCVFFMIGVDSSGNRSVFYIFRERGLSFMEQFNKIQEIQKHFETNGVLVESNQYQRVLADTLRDRTDIPIKPHHTGREIHDEQQGIHRLRIHFENKKYNIPYAKGSRRQTNSLLSELENMTVDEGKVISVGDKNDMVMALWLADLAVTKFGIGNRFELFK